MRRLTGRGRGRRWAATLGVLVLAAGWAAPAVAHLLATFNLRVVHFEHHDDGLTAYFRLTLPLVVAGGLGPQRADGTFEPAPYTFNRLESGTVFHYVDVDQVRRDVAGLGALVAAGHSLIVDDAPVAAEVVSARVHPRGQVPPFNTLAEVKAAVDGPPYPAAAETILADFALVDVALSYRHPGGMSRFRFSSTLAVGVLGDARTVNMLVDHGPDRDVVYRFDGFLHSAVTINPSPLSAGWSFTVEGIRHILEGRDHLLFIFCLTIGAATLGGLAWRVTGFTAGHTVTLIGGFLGYAPDAAWFMPLVEAAIALSIIIAALAVWLPRLSATTTAATAVIGLIHGFGFSYALQAILRTDAPNLLVSLGSFNVGVEIGQLAFILVAWPALLWLRTRTPRFARDARAGIAVASIAIASVWLYERAPMIWQAA